MRRRSMRFRRGQALVEYAILVAGVTLVALAAVTMLGHKTTHMMATTAAILPGAHADDNGKVFVGQLVETTDSANGPITIDAGAISAASGTGRLGENLFGDPSIGSQLLQETN